MAAAKEIFTELHDKCYNNTDQYKLGRYLEEYYKQIIKEFVEATLNNQSNKKKELLEMSAHLVVEKEESDQHLKYRESGASRLTGWTLKRDVSGYAKKVLDFINFAERQPEVFNIMSEIVENTIEKPLQQQISGKDKELTENENEINGLKQSVTEKEEKLSEQNKKMKILEADNKIMKKVLDKGILGQVKDKAKEIAQTVLDPVHTAQKAKLLDGLTNFKTKLEALGDIPVNTNDLFDYLVKFANIVAEFQDKNYKFSPQLLEATPQEANKLEEHTHLVGHGRLAPNKPGEIATKDNVSVSFMIKGDEQLTVKPLSYILARYGKDQDIQNQVKKTITKLLTEHKQPMIDLINKVISANNKPNNAIVKMVNTFGKENN